MDGKVNRDEMEIWAVEQFKVSMKVSKDMVHEVFWGLNASMGKKAYVRRDEGEATLYAYALHPQFP